jgi:ParB family transcriptional regulator, chromosome partitioning protein
VINANANSSKRNAEPPCANTKSALIVFGRNAGKTITVCTDDHCPVHDPATASRCAREEAENPAPVMDPPSEEETEEEAEQRQAEYEQRRKEHEAEQLRREEEREAEKERQQQEYEAEQTRREELSKARTTTFERILDQAPATFTAAQLRTFLRLLVHIDPYNFLEEVASHFAGSDENAQQTDEEIVLAALDNTADDKLTGLALRLVLTGQVSIPYEDQPDLLAEAEAAFAPPQPKSSQPKSASKSKKATTQVKASKKAATRKQKAA